jgi:2-polyprenyl-3-methyl-5-hydroxy-6-metoxy-1,4-benzoquinol methylase
MPVLSSGITSTGIDWTQATIWIGGDGVLSHSFSHSGDAHAALELGCGTGNGASPLANEDYSVAAVD